MECDEMFEKLKEEVCEKNLMLAKTGLITLTFGNLSVYDREAGVVAIKPSGVGYDELTPDKIPVMSIDGSVVEGNYRPSSDTETHLEIYRNFRSACSVIHTHSEFATAFAQARREIPAYGTTHGDYFYGAIPCTREMTGAETESDYEKNTGKVIVETFAEKDESAVPGVLVCSHGPFVWGKNSNEALTHAVVLEQVAKMAFYTEFLGNRETMSRHLLDRHFFRKHGKNAYYGQKNT